MPAAHNKLKVFGDVSSQTPDVINAYTTTGAETPGFVQDTFIYVDLLNTALRNCSLVTYSLVDILNPSADIMPGSEVGDGTTSGAEYTIKLALDKYIKEIKVDNAVQADKLSNSNTIGSTSRPVYFNNQGVPVQCNVTLSNNISGTAAKADTFKDNKNNSYKSMTQFLLDLVYPVGSIYMSSQNVSPQTFLGGTWVQITGTFLVAAGNNTTTGLNLSANATGGNKDAVVISHSHTASVSSNATGISVQSASTGISIKSASTGISVNSYTLTGHFDVLNTEDSFTQTITSTSGVFSKTSGGSNGTCLEARDQAHNVNTVSINATHAHGISDPKHAHTITDPKHTHSITDPKHTHTVTISTNGESGTNANLPPYRAVYMWERTA